MSEITRFEIDMLDVKAADAFLIHAFSKNDQGEEIEYVVLVDAGNERDGEKILSHIKKYYRQQYIDLVIITHCDIDHYGGMKSLIEMHNQKTNGFRIGKVWVHDPYKHVNVDDVKYIRKDKTLRVRLDEAYAFSDGETLLNLLDQSKITREEAYRGKKYDELNIEVLGPSENYYKSLLPDFRVNLDFKQEQFEDEYVERGGIFQSEDDFYSKALEDASDDPSKVNQSSVIFKFCPDNKVFLFTGDAGKEAICRVIKPDLVPDPLLKNIDWLKVPHHGSKHNLNNAIISYLHPNVSYISTEKYGKYANRCTVNALKKVGRVYSTHINGSMLHHEKTEERNTYSPATPL